MNQSVELRPAFEWTCEDCCRDQFVKCIVPEMTAEDMADLVEQMGHSSDDDGTVMLVPEQVTCAFCQSQFTTTNMDDEEFEV